MNAGEDVAFFLVDHPSPAWVTDAPWGDVRIERKPEPPAGLQYAHRNNSAVSGPFPLVHGHWLRQLCETRRGYKDKLCNYRQVWRWLVAIASRKVAASSDYYIRDIHDYIMKIKALKVPLENIDMWI